MALVVLHAVDHPAPGVLQQAGPGDIVLQEGYIRIKANSMTERDVMDKLVEASQAGVQVQLILRGICCLRPGI